MINHDMIRYILTFFMTVQISLCGSFSSCSPDREQLLEACHRPSWRAETHGREGERGIIMIIYKQTALCTINYGLDIVYVGLCGVNGLSIHSHND